MRCAVIIQAGRPSCPRCGRPFDAITAADLDTIGYAADRIHRRCALPGWGDRLAKLLAAVGITKGRATRLLGRECGCARRQAQLNRWGNAWNRWFIRAP